jgi:hypothetical protein
VVGGALDSPLRAVEYPEGCPDVVPTRHPGHPPLFLPTAAATWMIRMLTLVPSYSDG